MAKGRGKPNSDAEDSARQQKLPLIWEDAPEASRKDTPESVDPKKPDTPSGNQEIAAESAAEGLASHRKVPAQPGDEAPSVETNDGAPEASGEKDAGAGTEAAAGSLPSAAAGPLPSAAEPDEMVFSDSDDGARSGGRSPSGPADSAAAPAEPDASKPKQEQTPGRRRAETVSDAEDHPITEPAPAAAPAGGDGESVGDILMAARADLGYSIADVSAKTRVARNIIENLECNAFGALPAGFYCQAHIERLCELYNVDPEPILERFNKATEQLRGHEPILDHVTMASHESESGSMIRPMPEGSGGFGGEGRSISVTGILVSTIIGLFVIAALWALIALHLRNREADESAVETPAEGVTPAVELNEFIVPKQLDAYELPIPDRGGE